MTVAAMAMVAMKFLMLRSKRVATLRQSLKRQNMRSTTLRCLWICASQSSWTSDGMTAVVPRQASQERKALLS